MNKSWLHCCKLFLMPLRNSEEIRGRKRGMWRNGAGIKELDKETDRKSNSWVKRKDRTQWLRNFWSMISSRSNMPRSTPFNGWDAEWATTVYGFVCCLFFRWMVSLKCVAPRWSSTAHIHLFSNGKYLPQWFKGCEQTIYLWDLCVVGWFVCGWIPQTMHSLIQGYAFFQAFSMGCFLFCFC